MDSLATSLFRLYSQEPDRPVIQWDGGHLTSRTVSNLVQGTAEQLAKRISPGSRIALVSGNDPLVFPFILGALRFGAWVLLLDPRLGAAEVQATLKRLPCQIVVAGGNCRALPGDSTPVHLLADVTVESEHPVPTTAWLADAGVILTTSGTTGVPKGMQIDLHTFARRMKDFQVAYGIKPDDTYLAYLPAVRGICLLHALSVLTVGGKIVMTTGFEPGSISRMIQNFAVTVLDGTPTTWRMFLSDVRSWAPTIRQLRVSIVTGELVPVDFLGQLQEGLERTFIVEYGASEVGMVMIGGLVGDQILMRALPDHEIRIDPVSGEIIARSPAVMRGYIGIENEPETPLQDGWWHSGDLARLCDDGSIVLLGRRKDLIRRGAHTVFPIEVEMALRGNSAVTDAVAVGVPNDLVGELIVAFVSGSDDLSVRSLRHWCSSQLASFKVPDLICIVDEIPRVNGKANRRDLRNRALAWMATQGLS